MSCSFTRAGPRLSAALLVLASISAQPPDGPPGGQPGRQGPDRQGPGSPGPGGPGGPPRELNIKARFDANQDGVLDGEERARARVFAKENARRGPGPGGRGGRGARGGPPGGATNEPAAVAMPREPIRVRPDEVESYPQAGLYDTSVIRTIFLTFPQADWFEECADFYRTDVEVPATMLVDGKEYRDVGVAFRGNSSYFGAPGKKKSFGIEVDAVHKKQKLYGYSTLNLLNGHSDPSFVREAIHAFVARRFTPAFKTNMVRLVVNGESWGVYANVQQFNKDFLDDEFGTKKGARWKVPANFRGSGLAYVGDAPAEYERSYQLKGGAADADAAWQRLIHLCRTLAKTPAERLEADLPAVLDIDAALRFLAVDAVLLDGDGYASRGSDFVLWEGPDGRFRVLPYDSNEILGAGGMRGGRRGREGAPPAGAAPPVVGAGDGGEAGRRAGPPPGEPGADAAPPVGARRPRDGRDAPPPGRGGPMGPGGPMGGASPTSSPLALADSDRPLARLLGVPAWKARYLAFVRAMALEALDWQVLGPFVRELQGRIDPLVRDDEKALLDHAAFARSAGGLQSNAETRRKAILEHACMQLPWPSVTGVECKLVERDDKVCVQVTATVAGAASVRLWVSPNRQDPFVVAPMLDDGEHADGAKGDGVFGGATSALAKKGKVYVYVEAASPAGDAVAFSPSGGSGRPWVVDLEPK